MRGWVLAVVSGVGCAPPEPPPASSSPFAGCRAEGALPSTYWSSEGWSKTFGVWGVEGPTSIEFDASGRLVAAEVGFLMFEGGGAPDASMSWRWGGGNERLVDPSNWWFGTHPVPLERLVIWDSALWHRTTTVRDGQRSEERTLDVQEHADGVVSAVERLARFRPAGPRVTAVDEYDPNGKVWYTRILVVDDLERVIGVEGWPKGNDAAEWVVQFTYGGDSSRIDTITHTAPASGTPAWTEQFSYDASGRLVRHEWVDEVFTYAYTYDFSWPTREERFEPRGAYGGSDLHIVVETELDAAGRPVASVTDGGGVAELAWDCPDR